MEKRMQTPKDVLDTYYLEVRCMLLETAAFMDRYDAAVVREGTPAADEGKLECLRHALKTLADPDANDTRTKTLLELYTAVPT
jgi:hypothetical protein